MVGEHHIIPVRGGVSRLSAFAKCKFVLQNGCDFEIRLIIVRSRSRESNKSIVF